MLKLKFLFITCLFTGWIAVGHAQWLSTGTTTYYNPISNNIAIGTNTVATTKLLVIGNARFANTTAIGAGYAEIVTGTSTNTSLELGSTTTASQVDFKGSSNLTSDFRGRIQYVDGTGFGFQTAGSTTNKVFINESGYLGVGINPVFPYNFQVEGIATKLVNSGGPSYLIFDHLSGGISLASSGGNNPYIYFGDKYAINSVYDGKIKYLDGSGMLFYAGGSATPSIVIKEDNKVVIGDPSLISTTGMTYNYKLFVQDGIITERLKVAMRGTVQWADYIFEPGYELLSLDSVEAYTKAYKHLPGMPSADEVQKEGIDVANMDALLLKQIEELWLQLMILKKENEELRKMVQD